MDTKEVFKTKIEEQLAKWKPTMDGLKEKIVQAEVDAKEKLHDQLESLHDKRVKAEKILEEISATSEVAWEQVKAGAELGWVNLTRTAKDTVAKVREAIAKPKDDEEIRQIAYQLWLDEGRPDGRQVEHWLTAESIWHARQDQTTKPVEQAPTKTKRPRKKLATPAKAKSGATQSRGRRGKQSTIDSEAS